MSLDQEMAELEALIEGRFREHPHAKMITSMPGIGDTLGAEFVAATGGDMAAFGSADRLAGVAGLAPVPRDSGKISGNLRRPRRYSRRLLRMFYLSAQVASMHCPESKRFYQRKRAEGKSHKQAILALARRRLNVLWPSYETTGPSTRQHPERLPQRSEIVTGRHRPDLTPPLGITFRARGLPKNNSLILAGHEFAGSCPAIAASCCAVVTVRAPVEAV